MSRLLDLVKILVGFIGGIIVNLIPPNYISVEFRIGIIGLCLTIILWSIASQIMLQGLNINKLAVGLQTSNESLAKEIEALTKKVGVKVQYYGATEDRDRVNLFREARKVVEKATVSILVLTSYLAEADDSRDDNHLTKLERDRYYDALLARARSGITYKRILQLDQEQTVEQVELDEGYNIHFKKLRELQRQTPERERKIHFLKSPPIRPATFVIVDDTYLILQVNELMPSGKTRMYGIFIFQNENKEITEPFKNFFDYVRERSQII